MDKRASEESWACGPNSWQFILFLSLYRLTGGAIHLQRAESLANHLQQNAVKIMSPRAAHGGPDNAFSLFKGLVDRHVCGSTCSPENARFPGVEL